MESEKAPVIVLFPGLSAQEDLGGLLHRLYAVCMAMGPRAGTSWCPGRGSPLGRGRSGHRAWCGERGNQQNQSCELLGIHQQHLLLVKAGRWLRAIN